MRKLSEQELENLKEQLGGDIRLYDQPSDDTSEESHPIADARVASLEELREEDSTVASDAAHGTQSVAPKKRNSTEKTEGSKRAQKSSRESSDYSIRFGPKNSDRGSKVAIVSSKSKKIVYEQG